MGLMTGDPRSATIVASSDVYCYRLHRDDFQKIIQNRPSIIKYISDVLAIREVETQSVRDKLNEEVKNQRIEDVSIRLISKINIFFGLN